MGSWVWRSDCLLPLVAGVVASCVPQEQVAIDESENWQQYWLVAPGYSLVREASGFALPTAIAVVPAPGPDPKDPAYFVAELGGRIRVVTNDRSVLTFAEPGYRLDPVEFAGVFPSRELGMAGLCLDPETGYVFATFVRHDSAGILRNGLVRFETRPGTFATQSRGAIAIADLFESYRSAPSHQVGQCQIADGMLFVSVGDALDPTESRSLGSPAGKILRMDLNGDPLDDNPHFTARDRSQPSNYVWAAGFRNPFGLKRIAGELFAADNGIAVDRIVRVLGGADYLWDGRDASIGTNAVIVFLRGRGLAHMDARIESDSSVRIYQAASGDSESLDADVPPQILTFEYITASQRTAEAPRPVVMFDDTVLQTLTAVAVADMDVLFAGLFPDRSGTTWVYRLYPTDDDPYPFRLEERRSPQALMQHYGCLDCHRLYANGAAGRAPVLDRDSLLARLQIRLLDENYAASFAMLDTIADPDVRHASEFRHALIDFEGRERIRKWVEFRIREPRFDDPGAAMPQLAVAEADAEAIARFLVGSDSVSTDVHGSLHADALEERGIAFDLALVGAGIAIGAVAGRRLRRARNRDGAGHA